ncbi:uncharacterized protein LOC128745689 [Sabethes cyaneus]|uniref:uncharacterized protein LOC128745689 n=1 Tax=Sabethes cyaneus TaxID=53552 RepID=UPI00237EE8FE|nr:uncharacterized protein LOC128745689 [Sabethes cyaneus]
MVRPNNCVILLTSITVFIYAIILGPRYSTEALTTSNTNIIRNDNDGDHSDDDDRLITPVQLISPESISQNDEHGASPPRPLTDQLDFGGQQPEPKRMKLKVSTKRRKAGHGSHKSNRNSTATGKNSSSKRKRKPTMQSALQSAARKGLEAMTELFDQREPEIIKRGDVLDPNEPGALLSKFSSSDDSPQDVTKAGYAALVAAKQLKESTNVEYVAVGRQLPPKISLKRTPLEGMCPSRESPPCVPASRRYRTHDGTCNNRKKPRWGSAQMPFHRFLAPEYADGVDVIRRSSNGSPLPSARFVSLVVHGTRQEEAPVTMMLALWGQLLDHDLTATAQPRSLNGSTPRCCGGKNDDALHPSCLPIKVPLDDPWLSPLGVRCLEFLRSAPAQRRDCLLSWREQTNQVTTYIDASPIYSSNPRTSDNARIFRSGLLLFGRGPPSEDVCFRAALANQCIRPGDARSGEQPGLLMLHMVWVNEHNQIATQLSDINPHWSDEKVYQETRRIVGAMFQHITFREFLPIILGKQVCRLFDLELETSGFYTGYDPNINPTVTNEFAAAAFRFGHSLIQGSYMRADRFHRFIPNNVTLHEESAEGDLGGPGSLHRLVRGMVNQRALKRDEFITAELTNHLFQTRSFPFGLDLAAINIQRGRDHGIQPYINWRVPCGLTPIREWNDLERVMGPASAHRLRKAYRNLDDIDLFVGGLAERPVVGGIVGPTFSCIIAQQFSNLRKGDRFWYENPGFESSFTPAQLDAIRQVAFSQVLCRALGGGTLQPHAFLPADIIQNERLPCDSKLMAPIDLEPWTERDPFTRPNDATNTGQSENLIDLDAVQSLATTTSTTRQPTKKANIVSNVDFIPNGNVGLQIPSNGHIVLNSLTTSINNKLDIGTPTSASISHVTRPSTNKEPTLLAAPNIDDKLDLSSTTQLPQRKPTRKTTPKRRPTAPTNGIITKLDLKRDSKLNITDSNNENNHTITKRDLTYINLSKLFTEDDNATLLPKDIALRRGYYPAPAPAPPSDYDNYDYNSDADPPVFVNPGYGYDGPDTEPPPPPPNPYYYKPTEEPPQPPYCGYNCYPPLTTYNPYGLDTKRRPTRQTTPKRGLSNKIISVNYYYDTNTKQKTTRHQQQRKTTPKTVFQRPGLVVINDNRPNDKPIFLSASASALNSNVFLQNSKNPSPSAVSQSVFSVDPRPHFSSQPIAQQSVPSPTFFQRQATYLKPQKELRTSQDGFPSGLISTLKHDYDYDTLNVHEHDGYLRPEQNKYEPIKKTSDIETYRNYSLFNVRDPTTMMTYEIPKHAKLWTQTDSLRYATNYTQSLELEDDLDQFVRPYIYQDKTTNVPDRNNPADPTDKAPQTTNKTQDDLNTGILLTDKVDRTELGIDHYTDKTKSTTKVLCQINVDSHGPCTEEHEYERLQSTANVNDEKLLTKLDNFNETTTGTIDLNDNTNYLTDSVYDKIETTVYTDKTNYPQDKLNEDQTGQDIPLSTGQNQTETIYNNAQPTVNTYDKNFLGTRTRPHELLTKPERSPDKTLTTTSDDSFDYYTDHDSTDPTDETNYGELPFSDIADPIDAMSLALFGDVHGRSPAKDTIQAIPDETDSTVEHATHLKQDVTSDRLKVDRRPTSNAPRRRRPTNSKRPTVVNHGSNHDRRQQGIALVPFVLLTSIERPDNWVMFNVAKSKKRNPLPEVPLLKSDVYSLSELPKPISAED